jgi:pilus assembly protein Flp/PilA
MINKMRNLIVAEEGQGMTEYGLVLGVIAIAVVGILVTMRGQIANLFINASQKLEQAGGGTAATLPAQP